MLNASAGLHPDQILHGTDTMAYTASALSFLLEDLGKTVILTGAQIPLSQVSIDRYICARNLTMSIKLRNDAVDNLLGALVIAGHHIIPGKVSYVPILVPYLIKVQNAACTSIIHCSEATGCRKCLPTTWTLLIVQTSLPWSMVFHPLFMVA